MTRTDDPIDEPPGHPPPAADPATACRTPHAGHRMQAAARPRRPPADPAAACQPLPDYGVPPADPTGARHPMLGLSHATTGRRAMRSHSPLSQAPHHPPSHRRCSAAIGSTAGDQRRSVSGVGSRRSTHGGRLTAVDSRRSTHGGRLTAVGSPCAVAPHAARLSRPPHPSQPLPAPSATGHPPNRPLRSTRPPALNPSPALTPVTRATRPLATCPLRLTCPPIARFFASTSTTSASAAERVLDPSPPGCSGFLARPPAAPAAPHPRGSWRGGRQHARLHGHELPGCPSGHAACWSPSKAHPFE